MCQDPICYDDGVSGPDKLVPALNLELRPCADASRDLQRPGHWTIYFHPANIHNFRFAHNGLFETANLECESSLFCDIHLRDIQSFVFGASVSTTTTYSL